MARAPHVNAPLGNIPRMLGDGDDELWARWGPTEDNEFWAKAADVSRDMFKRVTGAETGLAPDRSNFDGTEVLQRDGTPTPFSYDSWRTVSNWSVDYSWWKKDARETALSDRIQKFLYGQGIHGFADRYTPDGKALSTRHSVGMVATTAVGSFAATPVPSRKRSWKNCGTRRRRPGNSATTTECST